MRSSEQSLFDSELARQESWNGRRPAFPDKHPERSTIIANQFYVNNDDAEKEKNQQGHSPRYINYRPDLKLNREVLDGYKLKIKEYTNYQNGIISDPAHKPDHFYLGAICDVVI